MCPCEGFKCLSWPFWLWWYSKAEKNGWMLRPYVLSGSIYLYWLLSDDKTNVVLWWSINHPNAVVLFSLVLINKVYFTVSGLYHQTALLRSSRKPGVSWFSCRCNPWCACLGLWINSLRLAGGSDVPKAFPSTCTWQFHSWKYTKPYSWNHISLLLQAGRQILSWMEKWCMPSNFIHKCDYYVHRTLWIIADLNSLNALLLSSLLYFL